MHQEQGVNLAVKMDSVNSWQYNMVTYLGKAIKQIRAMAIWSSLPWFIGKYNFYFPYICSEIDCSDHYEVHSHPWIEPY